MNFIVNINEIEKERKTVGCLKFRFLKIIIVLHMHTHKNVVHADPTKLKLENF